MTDDPFEKMNLAFKVGAKLILDCFPTLNDPKKMNDIEIKEEFDFDDHTAEDDYLDEYEDSEYEE